MNETILNSNEYNEMSLHFKSIYNEKEKEIKILKKKYLQLYKTITIIYGLCKTFITYGCDSSYIDDVIGILEIGLFDNLTINGIVINDEDDT